MAILKNDLKKNYTQIPNETIVSDLSDKAFRVLVYLFSKPDDWIIYQAEIAKKLGVTRKTININIQELKEKGYIEVEKIRSNNGFDYHYSLSWGCNKNVTSQKCDVTKMCSNKNVTHTNTNLIPKKNNTNTNVKKVNKKSFGEFGNVKLSEEEYKAVLKDYGNSIDEAISVLDDYIEQSGKKYKSHRAVLKKSGWVYEKIIKSKQPKNESKYVEPVYDGRKKQNKNELDDLPEWLGR